MGTVGLEMGMTDVVISVLACMRPHFDLDCVTWEVAEWFTAVFLMVGYAAVL